MSFDKSRIIDLGSRRGNHRSRIHTLADLNGDSRAELITIGADGAVHHYSLDSETQRGKVKTQRSERALFPQLPKGDQDYFITFADFDHDGDLDAVIDYLDIKPGQRVGKLRYFENYGSKQEPFFVHTPKSNVAHRLRQADRRAHYGGVIIPQIYDQVGHYQFADRKSVE